MSRTIYKYPIAVTNQQTLMLPVGATILAVQMQHGVLMLWAIVDSSAVKKPRGILVVGTGNIVPPTAGRYVATVQDPPFVWHLFEEEVR